MLLTHLAGVKYYLDYSKWNNFSHSKRERARESKQPAEVPLNLLSYWCTNSESTEHDGDNIGGQKIASGGTDVIHISFFH